jgi:hypothetical protein
MQIKKIAAGAGIGAAGLGMFLGIGACGGHSQSASSGSSAPATASAPANWVQACASAMQASDPNGFTTTDENGVKATVGYCGSQTTSNAPSGLQVPAGDKVVLSVFAVRDNSASPFDASGASSASDVLSGLTFTDGLGVGQISSEPDNNIYVPLNADGTANPAVSGGALSEITGTRMIVAVSAIPAGDNAVTVSGGSWTITAPQLSIPVTWTGTW